MLCYEKIMLAFVLCTSFLWNQSRHAQCDNKIDGFVLMRIHGIDIEMKRFVKVN